MLPNQTLHAAVPPWLTCVGVRAGQAKSEIERSWAEMERKAERALLDAGDLHKRAIEAIVAKVRQTDALH